MSPPQKEKIETCTDASLQILENAEESTMSVADDYIEVALEQKRKDAEKPLYFKRV
jgi:hypothetical protein